MRYEVPATLDEAIGLLVDSPNARVLAGGTDVLVQLRSGRIEPELLIDIKRIAEMRRIEFDGGRFRIGAAVTGAEVGECEPLKTAWPGVVEAVNLIGSTQVQGRATVGGNVCNASPAADSIPALIAAGAIATIAGRQGRRELAVEDLPVGPGRMALAKGEVVAFFTLPPRPPRSGDAYLRFIPRTEMDIAVVGVGVNLTLNDDATCRAARVAIGAVAERPLLVLEASKALVGSPIDGPALERLAAAVRAACRPIDDMRGTKEFRIEVAGVLACRAACIALERAKVS